MSSPSYKILVAKRLGIDPNALLSYLVLHDLVFCTTPDGQEHIFGKSDLDRPRHIVGANGVRPPDAKKTDSGSRHAAIPVAKTAQKGPGSPDIQPGAAPATTKNVAPTGQPIFIGPPVRRKPKK